MISFANLLDVTEENIKLCQKYLSLKGLVAFPTETVYGLGANAYAEEAVDKIFFYKQRPFTDPLILHVSSKNKARELYDYTEEEHNIFTKISNHFWPGPLTIVGKATKKISKKLTGGTDFIGVRVPNNNVSQLLLTNLDFPVAAPSANLFGHVSPTKAEHVLFDLGKHPIYILKKDNCTIGIESTVIKIKQKNITILRPGIITKKQIEDLFLFEDLTIEEKNKKEETNEAPGQLLKHYAPKIPAYIVKNIEKIKEKIKEGTVGIIDIGGKLIQYKLDVKIYIDLSVKENIEECTNKLFSEIRNMENKVDIILFVDISNKYDIWEGLKDRIYRAVSGKEL